MNSIKHPPLTRMLIQAAVFSTVLYITIQVALSLGVERKSWLHLSWEFLAGGSLGAIAGVTFFLLFGAIGWVCGALYGSISLLSLMIGGGLGGLGLGALANILRSPENYIFHWPTIGVILVLGIAIAHVMSSLALRLLVRRVQQKLTDV